MGHYRSRQSSGSSHAAELIKETTDAVRYIIADTIRPKGRRSSNSRGKVYTSEVLKYHVHGAEGQMWTNLGSWTDDKVDAIDFGSKHRKEKRGKHQTHCADHHHHHHHRCSRHYHSHSHTHHHHHHHHHHHDDRVDRDHRSERDLDDVSQHSDSAFAISKPRAPSAAPSSLGTRSSTPSLDLNDAPDLPPAYSQLSSRPGSAVCSRERGIPHHGATAYGVYPDYKAASEYGPLRTSRWKDPGVEEMKCRRELPVVFVQDDKGRRGREWEEGKREDISAYLIPEASAGTNLDQCPYLRSVHGSDQDIYWY